LEQCNRDCQPTILIVKKDYEKDYDEFWKDILEIEGVVDMEQVKRELADFHFMLEQVPKVYCEVTGSRISKPNTYAYEVIGEFNNLYCSKDITNDDLKEIFESDQTAEEKLEDIKSYFYIEL
jgi:hypothetical protein